MNTNPVISFMLGAALTLVQAHHPTEHEDAAETHRYQNPEYASFR